MLFRDTFSTGGGTGSGAFSLSVRGFLGFLGGEDVEEPSSPSSTCEAARLTVLFFGDLAAAGSVAVLFFASWSIKVASIDD